MYGGDNPATTLTATRSAVTKRWVVTSLIVVLGSY
jgi:hypothetical protein